MSVQKKERNQLRVCHFFAYEQSKIYEHYMGKIITYSTFIHKLKASNLHGDLCIKVT